VTATLTGIAGSICAVVLLAAGGMKLGEMSTFGQQIAAYQIIPDGVAWLAGYALPLTEVILGISIIFVPRTGIVAIALFASFAVAVGKNLVRGKTELRCGCFGASGKHTISATHVGANLGLVLLSSLVVVENRRPSFLAFEIGVSAILLLLLALAWRTILPPSPDGADQASKI
jgi:hypothetical protein